MLSRIRQFLALHKRGQAPFLSSSNRVGHVNGSWGSRRSIPCIMAPFLTSPACLLDPQGFE